jgi:hypothetical protein
MNSNLNVGTRGRLERIIPVNSGDGFRDIAGMKKCSAACLHRRG